VATVTVYVDGLNLYHGLKAGGYENYRWLDPWLLSQHLCNKLASKTKDKWELQHVHYFYSDVRPIKGEASQGRQDRYINAMQNHLGPDRIQFTRGTYTAEPMVCTNKTCDPAQQLRCPKCQRGIERRQEKRTDVSIAVAMLTDCCEIASERLLLITGDQDLVPAVDAAVNQYGKTVAVAVPPERESINLRNAASYYVRIKDDLKRSILPVPLIIRTGTGDEIRIDPPTGWITRAIAEASQQPS